MILLNKLSEALKNATEANGTLILNHALYLSESKDVSLSHGTLFAVASSGVETTYRTR